MKLLLGKRERAHDVIKVCIVEYLTTRTRPECVTVTVWAVSALLE